jgi:hypothetical protein
MVKILVDQYLVVIVIMQPLVKTVGRLVATMATLGWWVGAGGIHAQHLAALRNHTTMTVVFGGVKER